MAEKIYIDIVDGSSVDETKDGITMTRIAKVSGMSGSGHGRTYAALQLAGIPKYGDAHPSIPGIYVSRRHAEPESQEKGGTTIIKIELTYTGLVYDPITEQDQESCIEVGTTLTQDTTNVDRNGKLMIVDYISKDAPTFSLITTYGKDVKVFSNGRGWKSLRANNLGHQPETSPAYWASVSQTGTVPRMVPQTTLQVRRRENRSPYRKSITYVGVVCKAGWTLVPGSLEGEWMCMSITGSSRDRAATFDSCYSFQKGEWQPTVRYEDPDTHKPPADLADADGVIKPEYEGTAVKEFDIYFAKNFNDLEL